MPLLLKMVGGLWKKLPPWARTSVTRLTQPKFTVSVAGLITNNDGRVLLLNHLLRPSSGWGLPGGFINRGEQPATAFRREIREEIGLEIRDIKLLKIRTFKRHVEILFRASASDEGAVLSREIISLQWFAPDEIPREMNIDQQFLIRKLLIPDI
ncbi:MAG: NUDIX domain-containing protein [Acidobacteriota bacterium]